MAAGSVAASILREATLRVAPQDEVGETFAARLARKRNLQATAATKQPDGQISKLCPSPSAKIFRLTRRANHLYGSARLIRMRGGSRSSRTLRWDAVDAKRARDERARGGRRSRVVLTPRRWREVGGKYPAGDGGKKARSPGRARYKP